MSSTFRILFLLRKTKLNKNGYGKVVIRVTIDGQVTEFSSKLSVKPDMWNPKAGKIIGKSKIATEINNSLNQIMIHLNDKFRLLIDRDGYVTPEKLRDAYLGLDERKYTLLNLFDKKLEEKKLMVDVTIQRTALDKYICTRSKLVEFMNDQYNISDIPVTDVGYSFVMDFDIYLRSKYKCGDNTVVRHLRYVKQITTDALKRRYITIDPFQDITLSSKPGKRNYLTEEELKIILNKKIQGKTLQLVRDVFIFQCFTGLAYVDVSKLSSRDIVENGKGDKYIIKDRTKTGVESYVPLLETPLKILEKYKKMELKNNRLLPTYACQNMNLYIKEIAAICGINKKLSTHCGRHTFATLMLTKGISVESISKMLGHTDVRTTQIYAKILNKKVDDEVGRIKDELNGIGDLFDVVD